jgi:hypothetical protein
MKRSHVEMIEMRVGKQYDVVVAAKQRSRSQGRTQGRISSLPPLNAIGRRCENNPIAHSIRRMAPLR